MSPLGFHVFDSPVGVLTVAWSAAGVVRLRLPDGDAEAARYRARQRLGCEEAPPSPEAARVRDGVVRLLAGEPVSFTDAPFDFGDAPAFDQAVWRAIAGISPGRTATYGEIALAIDAPGEQRRVGQALGRNSIAIATPCHRVLGADGKPGGFSAPGGVDTKLKLLNLERRLFGGGGLFDDLPLAVRR